ncbi:hypothetical protein LINPERHAP1_LOCUS17585 [Linum perenne]
MIGGMEVVAISINWNKFLILIKNTSFGITGCCNEVPVDIYRSFTFLRSEMKDGTRLLRSLHFLYWSFTESGMLNSSVSGLIRIRKEDIAEADDRTKYFLLV